MGRICPIDDWGAIGLVGGKTIANRRRRRVASRHGPGERVLILDECRLDEAGRHLNLNPVQIAGSRHPCGVARLEPGRSGTRG
jgi:hypothetical protein